MIYFYEIYYDIRTFSDVKYGICTDMIVQYGDWMLSLFRESDWFTDDPSDCNARTNVHVLYFIMLKPIFVSMT
jgi:hypothetical protein